MLPSSNRLQKIASLKTLSYKDLKSRTIAVETTCIICYEDYADQDIIKELPCKHYFCKKCVDKWLIKTMNCPLCRKVVE